MASPPTPGQSAPSEASGLDEWKPLGPAAGFSSPGPHGASVGGHQLVVVTAADGPHCFAGKCPHQGALLSEGHWDGKVLTCPNHGWCFDAEGERVDGPGRLATYPVETRAEQLWVRLPDPLSTDSNSIERQSGARPVVRTLAELPHPPTLPFLGNAHQLPLETLHQRIESWADEYGCPFLVRIGKDSFVNIDDPETVDWVHRARPQTFRRFDRMEPVFKELGAYGVFAAEGRDWQKQRRLAVATLANRNLKAFYGTIARVTERLLGRWRKFAQEGTEFDLLSDLMLFTVDVTTTLAFGHDTNTIDNPDDRLQKHLSHVFPALERRLIAIVPYWRYVRFPKDRALDRSMAVIDEWIQRLVDEAQARFEKDPTLAEKPENFLEAMIAVGRETDEPFDLRVIKANILTMLLAGEDTTAGAVAWTIHEAIEHPRVVERLTNEASEVCKGADFPQSVENASDLRYTLATLNEALRVRAVAPFQSFTAIEDVVVQGVQVPAGTHVTVLTRRPATRPEVGGTEFSPERFLDEDEAPLLKKRGVYLPFGSGPRVCPGRSLALLEARILISLIFKNFEVERVGTYADVTERLAFTMAPHGLKIRLRSRT